MMLLWACVAYLTKQGMQTEHRSVLFQTQKEKKAAQLVKYAKTLYLRQDRFLQDAYPLTKPIDQRPALELHFANGSSIIGIPGSADQTRSYHPWGYLNDESSFQPEAGECYNEALSAVKGKIIWQHCLVVDGTDIVVQINNWTVESAKLPLRVWGFLRTEVEAFINITD